MSLSPERARYGSIARLRGELVFLIVQVPWDGPGPWWRVRSLNGRVVGIALSHWELIDV